MNVLRVLNMTQVVHLTEYSLIFNFLLISAVLIFKLCFDICLIIGISVFVFKSDDSIMMQNVHYKVTSNQ